MLLTLFSVCIIIMGIITLLLTAVCSIASYLLYWWDKQATQGTIILTTIGTSLIIYGSVLS